MADLTAAELAASREQPDIDRMIEEVEGLKREPSSNVFIQLIRILAIAMSLYHLYTAGFGLITVQIHRAVHLLFTFALLFLLFPATKKSDTKTIPWYDWILLALGVIVSGYIIVEYNQIVFRGGMPTT